jgi:LPXTG-motif cell wall-anchored protein
MMRRVLTTSVLILAILVWPAAASAQNSGLEQYTENPPGPGGQGYTPPSGTNSSGTPPSESSESTTPAPSSSAGSTGESGSAVLASQGSGTGPGSDPSSSSGTLANTGLDEVPLALIGLLLIAGGFALRRRIEVATSTRP